MKSRLFHLPFICLALLALSTTRTKGQTVVTFDDLHETASGSFFSAPYQRLVRSNFGCVNAVLNPALYGTDGVYYGMVSASNVAVNGSFLGSDYAEIDSQGTNFNFLSVYLTGEQRSNLNIEVQGFRSGTLLYDTTVVASATAPALFTFNYMDIDRLCFNSFGGQTAFFFGQENFVMDNLTFEFVPEPSSLLLATVGGVLLWPLLKRKRA
jgi:hypothetical protein